METIIYKSYTPSQKKATMKYREAHQEEYKKLQQEYYLKCKEDPEFKEKMTRFSHKMITQIDALTEIANEFSSFV